MWFFVVGVFTCVLAYILYTLISSSGSHLVKNSIDDFIEENTDISRASKPTFCQKYLSPSADPGQQLTVLFGTEYGCSEEVAEKLCDRLGGMGPTWQARLVNARYHTWIDWPQEQVVLVVISTSGDGVPPTDARDLCKFLDSSTMDLSHLYYSVLALGDSNYTHFCRTGKNIDKRFLELGARCLVLRIDIDMEDWSDITRWMVSIVKCLSEGHIRVETRVDYMRVRCNVLEEGVSRNRPFMAVLQARELLTVYSSPDDKETIHCEFDVSCSGITWEAGDAVGIYPQNNPVEVENLLAVIKCSGNELVEIPKWSYQVHPGERITLRKALTKYYNLKTVTPDLLMLSKKIDMYQDFLNTLLDSGFSKQNTLLNEYLKDREVVDVLEDIKFDCADIYPDILNTLKPLHPRYYSISSSSKTDENTICVTAAVLRYATLGKSRTGVATTFLQDRMHLGNVCPVFISKNLDFRLPRERSTPIIMIGPGTGIAPFRAFIQERVLMNAADNTLYFGCRHENRDFLYKDELKAWSRDGFLTLRCAFSRDQTRKIYVQDLLMEDGEKIWKQIHQDGAHIYVCGDAKHMAHDVHNALLNIEQYHGATSESEALDYLLHVERQGRYQKDVWVT